MKWRRYRFRTNEVDDYRPLVFNPAYPWWCSGHSVGSDFSCLDSTIVAYLPESEDLHKYWTDAYDIEFTEEPEITFTDRFPQPEWYKP